MDYSLVFVTLFLIAAALSLTYVLVGWDKPAAHFAALCLARTGVMAAGAVLVVVTVPVLSSGVGFEGSTGGAFLGALVVVAYALACERYVVLQETRADDRATIS